MLTVDYGGVGLVVNSLRAAWPEIITMISALYDQGSIWRDSRRTIQKEGCQAMIT